MFHAEGDDPMVEAGQPRPPVKLYRSREILKLYLSAAAPTAVVTCWGFGFQMYTEIVVRSTVTSWCVFQEDLRGITHYFCCD